MTEKEAIEVLERITRTLFNSDLRKTRIRLEVIETVIKALETLIKTLEQKDKIIDLMQNDLFEVYQKRPGTMFSLFGERYCKYKDCTDIKITCKECIKEYYERESEE